MTTETEIKLKRYQQVEREADVLGRVIGVRRLKPSEQTKIAGMTADLTGSDEIMNANGDKLLVSHRLPLLVTAAVCEIDGNLIPFPRNRFELDAMFDRLDQEGLAAAGRAMAKLQNNGDQAEDPLEAAKN